MHGLKPQPPNPRGSNLGVDDSTSWGREKPGLAWLSRPTRAYNSGSPGHPQIHTPPLLHLPSRPRQKKKIGRAGLTIVLVAVPPPRHAVEKQRQTRRCTAEREPSDGRAGGRRAGALAPQAPRRARTGPERKSSSRAGRGGQVRARAHPHARARASSPPHSSLPSPASTRRLLPGTTHRLYGQPQNAPPPGSRKSEWARGKTL